MVDKVIDNCCGCGMDVTQKTTERRLLSSAKSLPVLTLWKAFLSNMGGSGDWPAGYMCRGCFSAYQRFTNLQKSIEDKLRKASEALEASTTMQGTPKRMRLAASREGPSVVFQPPVTPRAASARKSSASGTSTSASPGVGVHIGYKQPRNYPLTPSRKKIGKAVARGSKKAIARECFKDPVTTKYVLNMLGSIIRREMKIMVSDNTNSVLRGQGLEKFTWELLVHELQVHAPKLLHLLTSFTKTKSERDNQKAIIGVCASILLKHRYSKMSLAQKVISTILYAGHTSKQTYTRLQKLNISMSHKTVTRLIEEMGQNYDSKVKEWQKNLERDLTEGEKRPVEVTPLADENESESESEDDSDSEDCTSSSDSSAPSTPSISPLTSEGELSSDEDIADREEVVVIPSADPQPAAANIPAPAKTPRSFSFVGDNYDETIKPRYMRVGEGNKSKHNFHSFGVINRVDVSHLSITPPPPPTITPEKCALSLLPSTADDREILKNVTTLVSRILATHLGTLGFDCAGLVEWHIHHEYQKEMSKKSEVVPLGIILKNENTTEGMVHILGELHKYVPTKSYTEEYTTPDGEVIQIPNAAIHPVLFGGDQLTVARARGAKAAKVNSIDPCKRFVGLLPFAEDWHTKLNFLGVIWRYFMSTNSSSDHGTLYQLRNVLGRTNVGKDPTKDFNACDDFFKTIISAHIITAFNELDKGDFDPETEWMRSDEERKLILLKFSGQIVDKYVNFSFNRHECSDSSDMVETYAKQILSLGCFYLEYTDAIKEADGGRILRCWRYLLPIFWNSNRTNYANEVLRMLYQHDYALSPAHKKQLIWERCINVHGRKGKNIPGDLHMEHLNCVVKDSTRALGSNKRDEIVVRVSHALGTLVPVLNNFDECNNISSLSGSHSKNEEREQRLLIAELGKSKVFKTTSSRKHVSFPKPRNVLHGRPKKQMLEWMVSKLNKTYVRSEPDRETTPDMETIFGT